MDTMTRAMDKKGLHRAWESCGWYEIPCVEDYHRFLWKCCISDLCDLGTTSHMTLRPQMGLAGASEGTGSKFCCLLDLIVKCIPGRTGHSSQNGDVFPLHSAQPCHTPSPPPSSRSWCHLPQLRLGPHPSPGSILLAVHCRLAALGASCRRAPDVLCVWLHPLSISSSHSICVGT